MSIPQFTAEASLAGANRRYYSKAGSGCHDRAQVVPALRWHIPGTECTLSCIKVCTRFCGDTGWDCCEWQTNCALLCPGGDIQFSLPATLA
jgi:hypothetical protein